MIFRGPFSDGYPITDLIFGIQHDISVIRWNKSLALLIVDMEKSLEAITSLGSQARRLMMKRLNYACSERSFWGTF